MIFTAYPEEQRDLRWVTVTLTSVATILLISRLTVTWRHRGWFGYEDALVIAANSFLIIFAALVFTATTHGFGMHVVDIQRTGGHVSKAMKFFWLTQVFYILTNGFNKMSFLMLYHRVFPIPAFRKAIWFMMFISAGWTISYVFVVIFQCTPIYKTWNLKTVPGHCISFFWHRWSNAILNLATDIIIFLLPLPVISRLNMSTGSRIGLLVLFSMGFFICLTTALRMATLPQTLHATEPTWESAPTNMWSFIEAAMGVICACLISLRRTIGRMWPAKWRSTLKGSGVGRSYGQERSRGWYPNGTATGGKMGGRHGVVEMLPLSVMKRTETSVSVVAKGVGNGPGPSESQEFIIEGITITKDVEVSGAKEVEGKDKAWLL